MLFNIHEKTVDEVKDKPFQSEKELQTLCENNLKNLINLDFVDTEFSVADFRLDTIAYDKEVNAFAIIEYKNQRNVSVIDQGYTYLSTMFNHKADFVLRYNIKFQDKKDLNDFEMCIRDSVRLSPSPLLSMAVTATIVSSNSSRSRVDSITAASF